MCDSGTNSMLQVQMYYEKLQQQVTAKTINDGRRRFFFTPMSSTLNMRAEVTLSSEPKLKTSLNCHFESKTVAVHRALYMKGLI